MTAPVDLAHEQRRVVRGAAAAMVVGLVILLAAWASGEALVPRADAPLARLAFALQLDLAVVGCLIVAIGRVANQRFRSAEDIGGSASPAESAAVREHRAVLQNTLEQVVLAVPVHLALALQLPPGRMAVIAALVLLFVAGRFAFARGYRRGGPGRAFGFGLTFYPTAAALVAAIALAVAA